MGSRNKDSRQDFVHITVGSGSDSYLQWALNRECHSTCTHVESICNELFFLVFTILF